MPLYREWSSDEYSLAAIWEITEPEAFFIERTGITTAIKNEKRRLEHLAGRFLLKYLKNDFPLLHIFPDGQDKPRLKDNQYYFSISHSYPYVAAVVSPYVECGIDVQVWHHRMEQLQHKFLSVEEQQLFDNDPRLLTLAWSAKEAAYKWQGRRGVEFIDHLPIIEMQQVRIGEYKLSVQLKFEESPIKLLIVGFVEQLFTFATVITK